MKQLTFALKPSIVGDTKELILQVVAVDVAVAGHSGAIMVQICVRFLFLEVVDRDSEICRYVLFVFRHQMNIIIRTCDSKSFM